MSVISHLEELRRRLFFCLVCIFVFSSLSLLFTEQILSFLKAPSKDLIKTFLILKPIESVSIYIKTALFSGLFFSAPFVFFQIFKFISPALENGANKNFALKALFISFVLFLAGIVFIYFAVLPRALSFLISLSYGLSDSSVSITLSSYISFVVSLLFCGGLIFQIPVMSFFLTKAGVLTPSFLTSKRKEAYFALIVFAAIITPTTDVFSLTLFAVPIIILYEIGAVFSKAAYKSQIKQIGEIYEKQRE